MVGWSKILWFVGNIAGSGVLAYAAPRFLVAVGVPLDNWIAAVAGISRENALWIATAAAFGLIVLVERLWHIFLAGKDGSKEPPVTTSEPDRAAENAPKTPEPLHVPRR